MKFSQSPQPPRESPWRQQVTCFFVLPFKIILCIRKQLNTFEKKFYITTINGNSLSFAIEEYSGTNLKKAKQQLLNFVLCKGSEPACVLLVQKSAKC